MKDDFIRFFEIMKFAYNGLSLKMKHAVNALRIAVKSDMCSIKESEIANRNQANRFMDIPFSGSKCVQFPEIIIPLDYFIKNSNF